MLLSLAVGLIILLVFGLASFVIAQGLRSKLHVAFAALSFATGVWIAANYLGSNFKNHQFAHYFIHADFALGVVMAVCFWLLSIEILLLSRVKLGYVKVQTLLRSPIVGCALAVALTTFSPVLLSAGWGNGKTNIDYGPLFVVYLMLQLGLVLIGSANLFVSLYKTTGSLRQQLRAVTLSLMAGVLIIALSNLILPRLTNSGWINLYAGNAAYLGIVLFIVATFYSMIVHRLFSMRLIVARTIAYTLSIGTFSALYISVTLLVSHVFLKDYHVPFGLWVTTVLALIFVASTILPIRSFFNRRTDSVFYRDAYDPQQLLDQLNRVLVDSHQVNILISQSAEIIGQFIKATQVAIVVNDAKNRQHLAVWPTARAKVILSKTLRSSLAKIDRLVIASDFLSEDQHPLRQELDSSQISIIAQLNGGGVSLAEGYLMLGPKKSGNSYGKQDIKVIEIIANELTIAIQNALRYEEIENFNATLQQRITVATEKLRRTNERLRELDDAKDDFVSMASHQLRTPLTAIKGNVSMVMEGDAGKVNDLQRQLLGQAFASSQRMVFLIADLLNVSRLKTGKFVIESGEVNLADMVRQEVKQLQETAASRQLTLSLECPESFPTLKLDETKTRQVIMNFIDNAIYYTPSGGSIKVTLSETDHQVELKVKDTGIGVPRSEQPHLFTKFYRAGNARKARPDGTGLGLFMAKKIIAAEGGALVFETKENKGSTFGFVFPKSLQVSTKKSK